MLRGDCDMSSLEQPRSFESYTLCQLSVGSHSCLQSFFSSFLECEFEKKRLYVV